MESKENELEYFMEQLKKNVVVSMTKYSLNNEDPINNCDALLNSVLLSWFDDVDTIYDFSTKYHFFEKLNTFIRDSFLFDLIETIEKQPFKDINLIHDAVCKYQMIVENQEYQELIQHSGYQIPVEFGQYDNYFGDDLIHKIEFYDTFCNKLDDIYNDFYQKRGTF